MARPNWCLIDDYSCISVLINDILDATDPEKININIIAVCVDLLM